MKKYLFVLVLFALGCKKENINPVTQADLLGTWYVDSIFSNNRMAYPSLQTVVTFKDNGYYTYNSSNHIYEIDGSKLVLDHSVSADFRLSGGVLWVHENIGNPVPGHFQDMRFYLSK